MPTQSPTVTPVPTPAFEPFDVWLENPVQPPAGTLAAKASVLVEGTAYRGVSVLPYVGALVGDKMYYILSGNRITTKMTPYMTGGKGKKKYLKFYTNIYNFDLARIPFTGLAPGRYPLMGAFLDSHGRVLGQITNCILTIE